MEKSVKKIFKICAFAGIFIFGSEFLFSQESLDSVYAQIDLAFVEQSPENISKVLEKYSSSKDYYLYEAYTLKKARQYVVEDNLEFARDATLAVIDNNLENFDAVEFHRVVGSGNHNTGVRLIFAHQIRHAGGGDDAQQHDIRADAAQTGSQRGFQHIAGNAGVLADEDLGAVTVQLGQHRCHTATDFQRQFTGQVLARHTADTVGTKKFTHNTIILSYCSSIIWWLHRNL